MYSYTCYQKREVFFLSQLYTMKQSISNSIREPFQPLGIACDLFGVTLFRYNCKSKVIQVFSSVYTILIFSIFLPIILYRIGYVTPTLCQSNAVAQSVIGIQQILGMLVIVAIYFQVVFYKSDMKHIFQLFLSIDKAFNQLNIKFDYRRFRWKIKIEVAIVIGFIYGSFLYFLMYYRVQAMFSVILEFFTSIQTILLIYLVLLIFINFGWHIRNKFIALKSLLVDVCAIETLIGCDADDLWKVKLIQETPQVVFCEIRKIAQIYEMLFKTINLLNRIFGLSNLATMALLGISLTCHLFLLFKTLTENSNIFADIRLEILGEATI